MTYNIVRITKGKKVIVRYHIRLVAAQLVTAILVVATSFVSGQQAVARGVQSQNPADARRITRPTSTPYDGDLSIFEDPKRAENLQINRVMDLLGIKQGSNVADIGAASGWFTVRAARRVGTKGTVYAVEINSDYLSYIEERAVVEKLSNIRTVLGTEDDPKLPPDSVNAVLILKTYHEIAQPIMLLARLRGSLRPGALVGVIDRDGSGKDHGINFRVVVKEAAEAGFSLVEKYDFVKPDGMDYFLVFRVAGAAPSH
ncbi:MAG: methyltransferase domain-containing protein [Blastocatellia bacterium]